MYAPNKKQIYLTRVSGNFPDKLKLADISPIFKAINITAKKNYRYVDILNSISKSFKELNQQKLNPFSDKILSDHLCNYRKGYSTEYALL